MQTIESRLASVERQLRFQRTVIAFLLIALVALVGYGAKEGVPEVIRARRIEVIGPTGKPGVVLKSIYYKNKNNEPINVGSSIDITDYHLDGTVLFRSYINGSVLQVDTIFGESAHLSKMVSVSNKEGKDIIYAGVNTEGGGLLTVSNKEGKDLFVVGASVDGDGMLKVYNKEGKVGIQVHGMSKGGGGGGVIVFNKTGEEVVRIRADDYGMGYVGAFDRQGKGRTLTPR